MIVFSACDFVDEVQTARERSNGARNSKLMKILRIVRLVKNMAKLLRLGKLKKMLQEGYEDYFGPLVAVMTLTKFLRASPQHTVYLVRGYLDHASFLVLARL